MATRLTNTDLVRRRYRPERIITLFVGESPPHNGDFFYRGGCNMVRHMKRAFGFEGSDEAFLVNFKRLGCYLDDLCLEPVDHLEPRGPERKKRWQEAQESLMARIQEYRPLAIVVLLLSIKPTVTVAAAHAGCDAPVYAVPFPNQWNMREFQQEMSRIVPMLPRTGDCR